MQKLRLSQIWLTRSRYLSETHIVVNFKLYKTKNFVSSDFKKHVVARFACVHFNNNYIWHLFLTVICECWSSNISNLNAVARARARTHTHTHTHTHTRYRSSAEHGHYQMVVFYFFNIVRQIDYMFFHFTAKIVSSSSSSSSTKSHKQKIMYENARLRFVLFHMSATTRTCLWQNRACQCCLSELLNKLMNLFP